MNYIIIIITIIISYWRAVKYGGYTIDDEDTEKRDIVPKNKWQRLWWQIKGHKYFVPWQEHLISVIIHAINSLLIYYVFGHNKISFMTAMLFAVNPAGTQGSVWLSGKPYAINTMWVLLMWGICPLFHLATAFFAFNGIFAPLLFLKTQWWWICLVPITFYLAKGDRSVALARFEAATGKGQRISLVKIVIVLKTLGYYFCLALIPTRLGIYHTFLYTYSLSKEDNKYWERIDKFFFVGCLIFGALIYGWFWDYNQAVFGLFWFVVLIVQWTNFISLNQHIAERYIYLPLIGIMYMVANLIMMIPDVTYRYVLFTGLFMYYWTRTQVQIPMYYNIMNCVEYGRFNFPDQYVYWTWMGQLEKRANNFFCALESWFHGWKMRKGDFRLNNNIAIMLTDMGYYKDAEDFLKNAEDNIIPEQREAATVFLNHERKRIEQAKIITHNRKVESLKRWKREIRSDNTDIQQGERPKEVS